MFKLECLIEDKNLAAIMHGLSGRVLNLSVVPVANATVSGGKVVAQTSGTIPELFMAWAKQHKVKQFRASNGVLAKFVAAIGKSPKSRNYVVKQLKQAGVIRGKGKGAGTVWVVVS